MSDKYEVIRPWHGVEKGSIVELNRLHPALASHVRKLPDQISQALVTATPSQSDRKELIKQRLSSLGIDFDGRKSIDELASLLPEESKT